MGLFGPLLVVLIFGQMPSIKVFGDAESGCAEISKHAKAKGYWVHGATSTCPAVYCAPNPRTGRPDPGCGACSTKYELQELLCEKDESRERRGGGGG